MFVVLWPSQTLARAWSVLPSVVYHWRSSVSTGISSGSPVLAILREGVSLSALASPRVWGPPYLALGELDVVPAGHKSLVLSWALGLPKHCTSGHVPAAYHTPSYALCVFCWAMDKVLGALYISWRELTWDICQHSQIVNKMRPARTQEFV